MWQVSPSAINDLAREYMISLKRRWRTSAADIRHRGNLAKANKPRKKRS